MIRDLVVRYGARTAVAGVSLTADDGSISALVGPNGAGKTSTVEVCVGLRTPSAGTVQVLGTALPGSASDRQRVHAQVGVMLQDGGLYPTARPLEMVQHVASLYPNPDQPAALLDSVGVDPSTRTTIRRLSGGEQRRVAAACALVGRPRLVFLDEPTTGLDATGRRAFHDLLLDRVHAGMTVVLTTHLLDDVERLADKVIVMADGAIVREGSVSDLVGEDDAIAFRGPRHMELDDLRDALPPGTSVSETPPGFYRISGTLDPMSLATVAAWCGQHGVRTPDLRLGRRSLEDVVIDLVEGRP